MKKENNDLINRKQAIKKMGRYAGLTALGDVYDIESKTGTSTISGPKYSTSRGILIINYKVFKFTKNNFR
jgi:hypothetical protein